MSRPSYLPRHGRAGQARQRSARWDGASETAATKKFWKAVLGISHSGTFPALSLHVMLSDTDDRDLYQNAGGIQVLAKAGVAGLQNVPREQLFTDEERNLKAVHLALDPLLGRTTSDSAARR